MPEPHQDISKRDTSRRLHLTHLQGIAGLVSRQPYIVVLALLAVVYIALADVCLRLASYFDGIGSPVWLPTGIAVAVLVLWGVRYWPIVLIGNFIVIALLPREVAAGTDQADVIVTGLIVGIGNSIESVVATTILVRFLGFDPNFKRLRDPVMLIAVAGIFCPMISVAFWFLSLWVMGGLDSGKAVQGGFIWWAGNLTGCVLAAPLVLAWSLTARVRTSIIDIIELLCFAAALFAIQTCCFGTADPSRMAEFPFAFLMFPPMVWAAMRFGVRGSATAAAAFAFITIRGTALGTGPFASPTQSLSESLSNVSVFLVSLGGTGLLLAAAIHERRLAADAHVQAEARYHQLVEQASDGIFVTDLQGNYVEANRRGLQMLGYTIDELREKNISDLIVIDASDSRPIRTSELNTGVHILSERRLRRKDGSLIPVEISAKKLGDGRFLGIVRDISQRRRDEAHRSMMMRELDHRVKNNLAVVLSIADQTARSVDTIAEFSERFIGRIMSLARVHGLLARSSWRGADLHELVTKTLQPHADGTRLRISGPVCEIPARSTSPLCMTLHELATNAAKYGSLSTPHGTVEVTWEVEGRDTPSPMLRLAWSESGGPLVIAPVSRGFGTTLIEAGMAHELGANVKLDFHPTGVRCLMDFSIASEPSTPLGDPVNDNS